MTDKVSETNHDAAPAATARTDADRDRTDKPAARPGEGTGDISVCPYITGTVTRYCTLTPLTLTDEEREAIRFAAVFYAQGGRAADAATLRNLIERLT